MTTSAHRDSHPAPGLPRIDGFELLERIGEGGSSVVHRVQRGDEHFAVKFLKPDAAGPEATIRFRREAAALARLQHPSLVRIIEFSEAEGVPYLVMELVAGQSLEQRLAGGPLHEPDVIRLGVGLAGALQEVHRSGFVHRDIKPSNILLQSDGSPKIVDFGFVRALEGSTDERETVGTFVYAAPEQSGALQRPVDGRADLYSLGALLHRCATGAPPYAADDVGTLIRRHLTDPIPDICASHPEFSPVLGAIVAKLLAKDPDDRYQTGRGLAADLENIATLERERRNGALRLAAKDVGTSRGDRQVPILGRAEELAMLVSAWRQASAGEGRIVLVEGEAGSGKTRLVRELFAQAKADGALILAGKADQSARSPLAPLRDAIDEHIGRVLRLEGEEKGAALTSVRAAAGEFGALVKRLSAGLSRAIGEAREVRPLDPASEQARFYETVASFILALPGAGRPLLLLVDDVQWIDDGTLEVLRRMSKRVGTTRALVVATSRNDAASVGSRDAFVKAVGSALAKRVELGPLKAAAVGDLVAAHLGGRALSPSVVELLATRANGNPFAIGEYVRSLLDGGALRPSAAGWTVDERHLHEVSLSGDVIRLLVARLGNLSPDTVDVLSSAALCGVVAPIELLARVSARGRSAVRRAVEEAERSGMVEVNEATLAFVHDRVREALIERLTAEERRARHQDLALAMDAYDDGSEARVYALAHHYAAGSVGDNPRRVFETCRDAGVDALGRFANQEAFELLSGADAAVALADVTPSERALLGESLGIAAMRTGRQGLAHEQFRRVLEVEPDVQRHGWLHFLIGQAYASEGKNEEAWQAIQRALRMVGAGFPTTPFAQRVYLAWYWLLAVILPWTGIGFGAARGAARARRQLISRMNTTARFLAYFLGSRPRMAQVVVRELLNAHFLGATTENAKGNAFYAFLIGLVGNVRSVRRHGERGVTMARQLGDPEAYGYCRLMYGTALEFAGDNIDGQKIVRDATADVVKYCSASDASSDLTHVGLSLVFQGRAKDAVDWFSTHLATMNRLGALNFQCGVWGGLYSQRMLLGRVHDAMSAHEEHLRIAQALANVKHAQAAVRVNAMMVLLDQEDFGPELEENIRAFLALEIDDYHRRVGYVLVALARNEQLRRSPADGRREAASALAAAVEDLRPRAIGPVHACHLTAMEAALAAETGHRDRAPRLLARAEALAAKAESVWGAWVVRRERARLAHASQDDDLAHREARQALRIALSEGWRNRADQVRREFDLREQDPLPSTAMSSQGVARANVALEGYAQALLDISLACASAAEPVDQARATLDELLRLLGAERGFLFVHNADRSKLDLLAGRDSARHDLPRLTGYSTSVVAKVEQTRTPIVASGTDAGEVLASESAVALDLRSIMAAPLMIRERLSGVLYLDTRVVRGLFREDDLRLLKAISNQLAVALETSRMARLEAIEKDVALTAAVQKLFLPPAAGHVTDAFELHGCYQAAEQCSGDWWWFDEQARMLDLFVGDVTGHGAAAAMITASAASAFRVLRRRDRTAPLDSLLREMHVELREVSAGEYRMTMAALAIDGVRSTLRWWSAGAPPAFVLRGGKVTTLTRPGTPLGETGELVLGFRESPFERGDRLFVFTDGAFELESAPGRQLGLRRLSKMLMQTASLSPAQAASQIRAELLAACSNNLADDITFVLVERR